ncbi:Os06g0353100 [Oryza sativa Japonica Group]|uniref:Os06g0353100 protein n=1 Tax=Oryza sativa subsp. japonica TaxID=39947 RepID=A0A0P0WWI9_ORYSJ|nr:Os06g0353100 [Oryza sativa Japonica Group]
MATTVELDGDGADSGWRWSCAGISGSDGEVHGTEAGCGEPTGDGRRGRGWRRQDVDFMEVDHVVVLCGDLGQRRRGAWHGGRLRGTDGGWPTWTRLATAGRGFYGG